MTKHLLVFALSISTLGPLVLSESADAKGIRGHSKGVGGKIVRSRLRRTGRIVRIVRGPSVTRTTAIMVKIADKWISLCNRLADRYVPQIESLVANGQTTEAQDLANQLLSYINSTANSATTKISQIGNKSANGLTLRGDTTGAADVLLAMQNEIDRINTERLVCEQRINDALIP